MPMPDCRHMLLSLMPYFARCLRQRRRRRHYWRASLAPFYFITAADYAHATAYARALSPPPPSSLPPDAPPLIMRVLHAA